MASMTEQCQVAPPPCVAAEVRLPLTYFDHPWLGFHRMRRILFYKLPISKLDFVQNIIPPLKDSLSHALKHYTPLAGNVACPLDTNGYPEIRYVIGDSVSLIFSESDMDFSYLISDHPRSAKDFYHLVPKLGEPKDAPGIQLAPLLAIQVTLFPNHGVSIGFTNHHVVGDGATIVGFVRAWALLHKFGGHEQFLSDEFIPFYDRSVLKDPYGQGKTIWEEVKKQHLEMRDTVTPPPGHRLRGNYRARFNPPLPQSYFGNCLVAYVARASHVDLAGKQGFTIAVELIGEAIQKRMKDEEWVLNGGWFKEIENVDVSRMFSVAGSPKLDLYAADFGWGKATKLEFISIDNDEGISMSLSKSKDFDGDLEIGLCLSKTQMNAFAAIFTHGLNFLYQAWMEEG